MGLNVNCQTQDWPQEVAKVSTSIADETGTSLRINRLVSGLIQAGMQAFEQYLKGNYKQELSSLWKRFDWLQGKQIRAQPANKPIFGTANGIDEDGRLILLLDNNDSKTLNSGEVTLRTETLIP